jgi:hypothetical protein
MTTVSSHLPDELCHCILQSFLSCFSSLPSLISLSSCSSSSILKKKKNSAISWWSVFLWRKPEYTEKTTNLSYVTDKLSHIMLYRVNLAWAGLELITLVVIGIDCICSCKSNYHTILTTTTPQSQIDHCDKFKTEIKIHLHMYQTVWGMWIFKVLSHWINSSLGEM